MAAWYWSSRMQTFAWLWLRVALTIKWYGQWVVFSWWKDLGILHVRNKECPVGWQCFPWLSEHSSEDWRCFRSLADWTCWESELMAWGHGGMVLIVQNAYIRLAVTESSFDDKVVWAVGCVRLVKGLRYFACSKQRVSSRMTMFPLAVWAQQWRLEMFPFACWLDMLRIRIDGMGAWRHGIDRPECIHSLGCDWE